MTEHFPGVKNLNCPYCDKNYNLEEIWEQSGCDCHLENGSFNCTNCNYLLEFKLNLDIEDNINKLTGKIINLENNNNNNNNREKLEFERDLIGKVEITYNDTFCTFKFKDIINKFKGNLINTDIKDTCVVCLDEDCDTVTTCHHHLCEVCYSKLDKCPYCRQDFTSSRNLEIITPLV